MSLHDAPTRKKLYVGVDFVLMTVATLNKGEFITLGARGYAGLLVALVPSEPVPNRHGPVPA